MTKNISLLEAVVSTLDTIPVVGIDAQDKFVGCALTISNVIRSLKEEQQKQEAAAPVQEEKEGQDA